MPGGSKRVKGWVKHRVFIQPKKKVPPIRKKNARCLRAQDELFDSNKHAFVARKINDDFTARVAIRA